jgi:hypothetical protein
LLATSVNGADIVEGFETLQFIEKSQRRWQGVAEFGAIFFRTHRACLEVRRGSDISGNLVQIGFENVREGFYLFAGENDPLSPGKKKIKAALLELIHSEYHLILQLLGNWI